MNKFLKIFISITLLLIILLFSFIKYKNIKETNLLEFKNPIIIVFVTDDNYATYLRTSIRSIIANKNPQTNIEINVLGLNLSHQNINKIISENTNRVKIKVISISDNNIGNLQGGSKYNPFVTKVDNAKFYLSSILDKIDKVLYLDADTIILKDLQNLYNTDLKDNYVAAVDDWQTKSNIPENERYFNNGVMLLNLKKIREDKLEDKLISSKLNNKYKRFVTQDAFNDVMYPKVMFIDLTYDTFAPEYDDDNIPLQIKKALGKNYNPNKYPYLNSEDFRKAVTIIHYCGYYNIKPWDKIDFTRKSGRIWYKYAPFDFWKEYISNQYVEKDFENEK